MDLTSNYVSIENAVDILDSELTRLISEWNDIVRDKFTQNYYHVIQTTIPPYLSSLETLKNSISQARKEL